MKADGLSMIKWRLHHGGHMLKVIIVDDEQPARDELNELLTKHASIEVIAQCSNALEAIPAIHKLQPDVIFLDIQMPRISGLELVSMLDPDTMPYIVLLPRLMSTLFRHLKNTPSIICLSQLITAV